MGLCVMAFIKKLHKKTNLLTALSLFVSRGDKRLAKGRSSMDEDAGGERHSQGEDPAYAGRCPEE